MTTSATTMAMTATTLPITSESRVRTWARCSASRWIAIFSRVVKRCLLLLALPIACLDLLPAMPVLCTDRTGLVARVPTRRHRGGTDTRLNKPAGVYVKPG